MSPMMTGIPASFLTFPPFLSPHAPHCVPARSRTLACPPSWAAPCAASSTSTGTEGRGSGGHTPSLYLQERAFLRLPFHLPSCPLPPPTTHQPPHFAPSPPSHLPPHFPHTHRYGTVTHQPPEALGDENIIGYAGDIYGFGVLLWQVWGCVGIAGRGRVGGCGSWC